MRLRKNHGFVVCHDKERIDVSSISFILFGLICGLCGQFSISFWKFCANLRRDERGGGGPIMWIAIAAIVIAAMIIIFYYIAMMLGYEFAERHFDNP